MNRADFVEHVAHAVERRRTQQQKQKKEVVGKLIQQQLTSGKKKVQGAVMGASGGAPLSISVNPVLMASFMFIHKVLLCAHLTFRFCTHHTHTHTLPLSVCFFCLLY